MVNENAPFYHIYQPTLHISPLSCLVNSTWITLRISGTLRISSRVAEEQGVSRWRQLIAVPPVRIRPRANEAMLIWTRKSQGGKDKRAKQVKCGNLLTGDSSPPPRRGRRAILLRYCEPVRGKRLLRGIEHSSAKQSHHCSSPPSQNKPTTCMIMFRRSERVVPRCSACDGRGSKHHTSHTTPEPTIVRLARSVVKVIGGTHDEEANKPTPSFPRTAATARSIPGESGLLNISIVPLGLKSISRPSTSTTRVSLPKQVPAWWRGYKNAVAATERVAAACTPNEAQNFVGPPTPAQAFSCWPTARDD